MLNPFRLLLANIYIIGRYIYIINNMKKNYTYNIYKIVIKSDN